MNGFIIRMMLTVGVLYMSFQETQSGWTTAALAMITIGLEAQNFVLLFITKQTTALHHLMCEIKDLADK